MQPMWPGTMEHLPEMETKALEKGKKKSFQDFSPDTSIV